MPHKDLEARRVYRQTNKDRIAAAHSLWYAANKEKIREYNRTYEATHKDKRQAINARKDPEKERARYRRYHATHAEQERKAGKIHDSKPERKARQAERVRKQRLLDPIRVRKKEKSYHDRKRETAAGRPRPDACEICAATHRKIMWDHCHQKGHFRGWICQPCNIILGMSGDSPQRLLKVIAYLQRTKESTSPQLVLSGI
jgi:hypothetical protein